MLEQTELGIFFIVPSLNMPVKWEARHPKSLPNGNIQRKYLQIVTKLINFAILAPHSEDMGDFFSKCI